MPTVNGTAQAGTTVRIYALPGCAGGVVGFGVATGGVFGITVTASAGLNTYFGTATDASSNVSGCSTMGLSYTQDSVAPGAPQLTSTSPASPSQSNAPIVNGTAEAGATVELYGTSNCTGTLLGSAQAAGGTFAIPISVTDNTTVTVYGRAIDAATNRSGCSAMGLTFQNIKLPTSPLYSIAPNWNDYVRNDGATRFNASNTACAGTEAGNYFQGCLHGATFRRFQLGTGQTSCANVAATDALGVFTWVCDASTTPVRVVSVGLQPGKSLSDLIDFGTLAWRPNQVDVTLNGTPYLSSTSTVWYSNPVTPYPVNGQLLTGGSVYVVASSTTGRVTFLADRVAMVVRPGQTLTGPATGGADMITANTRAFIWLEGRYDEPSHNAARVIDWVSVRYSVVRSARLNRGGFLTPTMFGPFPTPAVHFNAATSCLFKDVVADSDAPLPDGGSMPVGVAAFWLEGGTRNIFDGLRTAYVDIDGDDNVVVNSVVRGSLRAYSSANNVFQNVTVFGRGIGFHNTATVASRRNLLRSPMVAGSYAIQIGGGAAGAVRPTGITVENAMLQGTTNALNIDNAIATKFTGNVRIQSPASCVVASGAGGSTPADQGVLSTCFATGASDYTWFAMSGTLDTALATPISGGDTANASDTNGSATFTAITDWTRFDNPFRLWATTPWPANDCQAGICRIWDVRLKALDPENPDRSLDTNPCPSALATATFTHQFTTGAAFAVLRNSMELFEDGLGDDDTFCESNEACLYTPHKGAYQGSGALVAVPGCLTAPGFSNITGYRYQLPGE